MHQAKAKTKILVVTTSSGGHIFPALSFLDTLKEKDSEIDTLLVMPSRSRKLKIDVSGYEVRYLSIMPFELTFDFRNFVAILKLIQGSLESFSILLEFKPDIVVGFGGLDSVNVLLLAWLLRVKTLIHEQNVMPGRASRFLAKFTNKIAISFAQTKDYLKINPNKIALTGNPIRRQLKSADKLKALEFFGFSDEKLTLLVVGGSLGSHRINEAFLRAISSLTDKSRFQIIHISGAGDLQFLENSYKDLNIKFKLFDFLKEMQYAYCICDFAICRAGATTIAELIFFKTPAVIIPYPFAYGHQLLNARILEKMGTAFVIRDSELDANALGEVLANFTNYPEKIKIMSSHYEDVLQVNANDLLLKEALSLIKA